MRPEDFVRSLTYGDKQPEHLGLDSYQRFEPSVSKLYNNSFLNIKQLQISDVQLRNRRRSK